MNTDRIKEIQQETAYPESISVQQALLKVWNECEQEQLHIADVRCYQIDFGNHLRCKIKVTDNGIEVEGAINGWGDGVPLDEVVVVEVQ